MKKIVTYLYNDDDEESVLCRAETTVETLDDIARHLEKFHSIETVLKRQVESEDNILK